MKKRKEKNLFFHLRLQNLTIIHRLYGKVRNGHHCKIEGNCLSMNLKNGLFFVSRHKHISNLNRGLKRSRTTGLSNYVLLAYMSHLQGAYREFVGARVNTNWKPT